MKPYLIKGATLVNEGEIYRADVLIKDGRIQRIEKAGNLSYPSAEIIGAEGLHLFPGVIDDQVHFREPGLTHKGDIATESAAAVAGGVTSFMEMPNTVPNTFTQELLESKYLIAASKSLANYSFYMGASNDNIEEVLKTDGEKVCGIKVFMGSSTGNMLVDNEKTLENIFSRSPLLIATHCEDEATVRRNLESYQKNYGEQMPAKYHPEIRSEEACYKSSSLAVSLAKKHNARLHVLHISTERELSLFDNTVPLSQKRIIHHLWFDSSDYDRLGNLIKWNPAVKTDKDKKALLNALKDDRLDVIATDHAPHTWEEKQKNYFQAPSGGPLVQHSLVAMLDLYHQNKISLEAIAEKMCHSPAVCFRIRERGYIREGYWADLVLVKLNSPWFVSRANILAKCGWSPFEGHEFRSAVSVTFVNGYPVYNNGTINAGGCGQRLSFMQ
jgi:dihydroorotase